MMCSPGLFGQTNFRRTASPAITRSTSASVACSSHWPFTCTAGAPPHAARHSTRFTVNFLSAVVSPGLIPSFLQVDWSSPSAPFRVQERVVHTSMSVFPGGSKANML